MKKIGWILVIITMISGCGEARHPMLKEAADIIHQHPDSARVLINKVDTTSLSEADLAEYHLLRVMTDYIVLHQADGDSLVTTCVDYYDKHGDAWHRGRAYYYRAGIRMPIITGLVSEGIYSAGRLMPLKIIRWLRQLLRMQMTNC